MKHLFRFHGRRGAEGGWELFEDEWHHLLKVLRLREGDKVEIADGLGWVASATLGPIGKQKGELVIEGENFTEKAGAESELVLGLFVLKPQSLDEILPGLVELGVSRVVLIPFIGMEKSRINDKLLDRWARLIVSAGKQAKAAWFPELAVAKSLEAFLSETSPIKERFLLDPAGDAAVLDGSMKGPILAVIGHEGGWHESEFEQMDQAGFRKLRMKSHVLRATTAALATAAILRQSMAGN